MIEQLRIGVMLPGEASVGAFEAGGLGALLTGVQAVNRAAGGTRVAIDAISGASSGALAAVLAARILVTGRDPVDPLHRAWVREPSISALRAHATRAPLSLDRARQLAYELLAAEADEVGPPQERVWLTLSLASLRGFNYCVEGTVDGERYPVHATSYTDYVELALDRRLNPWQEAVDAAIASASHPLAFPPVALDRSKNRQAYVGNGIMNLPEGQLDLWYADGGLLDRQPLGRCLRLVADRDRDEKVRRMVVLLRTNCDVAPSSHDPAWSGLDREPQWGATLGRALRVLTAHSVYEDVRRAQKTNNYLKWTDDLATDLAEALDGLGDADRERVLGVLRTAGEKIAAEKDAVSPPVSRGRTVPREDLKAALCSTLRIAAGLDAKVPVHISEVAGSYGEIAGESLARFGGFFAERSRSHDFLLGYRDMTRWLNDTLRERGGLHDPDIAVSAAQQRARTIPGWIGGRGDGSPGLRTQAAAVGLGVRALGLALRERMERR
jgi:predicted acylesterase/phospholipase RssA